MRKIIWTVLIALSAVFFGHHAKAGVNEEFSIVTANLLVASGIPGISISITNGPSRRVVGSKSIEIGISTFRECEYNAECIGWVVAHEIGHIAYNHYKESNPPEERIADRYGRALMLKAGYRPLKALVFMRNNQRLYGNLGFPSHPNWSERIQILQGKA